MLPLFTVHNVELIQAIAWIYRLPWEAGMDYYALFDLIPTYSGIASYWYDHGIEYEGYHAESELVLIRCMSRIKIK